MGCGRSSIKKKVIFLIGKPGSGQKTQAINLKKKIGSCDIIQVESLIGYEMLIKSSMKLDQINEDKLVPSNELVKILNEKIKYLPSEYIIVEAFPKNENNVQEWKNIIGKKILIHSLIYLKIDDKDNDKIFEREKDKIDSMGEFYVEKRLKTFNEHTLQIIQALRKDINVIDIHGEKNENDVSEEIWKKFKELNKIGVFHHLN